MNFSAKNSEGKFLEYPPWRGSLEFSAELNTLILHLYMARSLLDCDSLLSAIEGNLTEMILFVSEQVSDHADWKWLKDLGPRVKNLVFNQVPPPLPTRDISESLRVWSGGLTSRATLLALMPEVINSLATWTHNAGLEFVSYLWTNNIYEPRLPTVLMPDVDILLSSADLHPATCKVSLLDLALEENLASRSIYEPLKQASVAPSSILLDWKITQKVPLKASVVPPHVWCSTHQQTRPDVSSNLRGGSELLHQHVWTERSIPHSNSRLTTGAFQVLHSSASVLNYGLGLGGLSETEVDSDVRDPPRIS